jgi:hypothetical protein
VLRYSNGGWRQYDQDDAWGLGLGEQSRPKVKGVGSSGPSNQEILNKLLQLEAKLNGIQPSDRPSLEDIQNLIKARP